MPADGSKGMHIGNGQRAVSRGTWSYARYCSESAAQKREGDRVKSSSMYVGCVSSVKEHNTGFPLLFVVLPLVNELNSPVEFVTDTTCQ